MDYSEQGVERRALDRVRRPRHASCVGRVPARGVSANSATQQKNTPLLRAAWKGILTRMQSLAWRNLKSFAWNSAAALNPAATLFGTAKEENPTPQPRLTIRVGVAGHLDLRPHEARIGKATRSVLAGIVDACNSLKGEYESCFRGKRKEQPEPCFRLITSLAAGADQLAAEIASGLGYALQVVLPAPRAEFRKDITANAPHHVSVDSGRRFDALMEKKEIVFELDGVLSAGGEDGETERTRAYANAARVVLANSDVLVVILSDGAGTQRGGTLWLARHALRAETPLILIPIEEPEEAEILWHHDGKEMREPVFSAEVPGGVHCSVQTILRHLLLLPEGQRPRQHGRFGAVRGALRRLGRRPKTHGPLPDSRGFERRYRGRLDEERNRKYWEERWASTESPECPPRGADASKRQIDRNFKEFAVWADHRASAYGEMYRGAFAASAVLGATAVSFALLNVLFPGLSVVAKTAELFALAIVLAIFFRAAHYGWNERWLNYRRLERHLNAAAWLALLGQTIRLQVPAHGSPFHDQAVWENWYTRAVLRQGGLPEVRMGRDHLNAVRDLVLSGLVRDQIRYYKGEIEELSYAEHVLETLGRRFIAWAFFGTLSYLVFHGLHESHLLQAAPGYEWMHRIIFAALKAAGVTRPDHQLAESMHRIAIALGAGLPAWAGAFAAIRSQSEYNQIALRYGGQIAALTRIAHKFELMSAGVGSGRELRFARPAWNSADLTRLTLATTGVLTDELHHWHSILMTKEIEPT